jgi:hypothetical protein
VPHEPPEQPSDPLGFPVPVPKESRPRRSPSVTAAAVILILTGALSAIGFLVVISTPSEGQASGRFVQGAALVFLSFFAINLLAGVLVLRLRPNGRSIGLLAAGIGVVFGLARLESSPGQALITLAFDGFVLWVLITEGHAFGRGTGG